MITQFKMFESINMGKPEVGDYVIYQDSTKVKEIQDFVNSEIGIITHKFKSVVNRDYDVKYDNIPISISFCFPKNNREMKLDEIEYWSKDKTELEAILASKKYNL